MNAWHMLHPYAYLYCMHAVINLSCSRYKKESRLQLIDKQLRIPVPLASFISRSHHHHYGNGSRTRDVVIRVEEIGLGTYHNKKEESDDDNETSIPLSSFERIIKLQKMIMNLNIIDEGEDVSEDDNNISSILARTADILQADTVSLLVRQVDDADISLPCNELVLFQHYQETINNGIAIPIIQDSIVEEIVQNKVVVQSISKFNDRVEGYIYKRSNIYPPLNPVESILGVPIIEESSNLLLGVLIAFNNRNKTNKFTENDKRVLQQISDGIGAHISTSLFIEETLHAEYQARSLLRVTTLLAAENDLSKIIALIVQIAYELLHVERVTLFLVHEASKELEITLSKDASGKRISMNSGIAGYVARTGNPVNIKDASTDPRFDHTLDIATGFKTHCILCYPIMAQNGKVIAVIQVLNKTIPGIQKQDQNNKKNSASASSSSSSRRGRRVSIQSSIRSLSPSAAATTTKESANSFSFEGTRLARWGSSGEGSVSSSILSKYDGDEDGDNQKGNRSNASSMAEPDFQGSPSPSNRIRSLSSFQPPQQQQSHPCFNADDELLLEMLAKSAGVTMRNALLLEEVERSKTISQALLRLVRCVVQEHDLVNLLQVIVDSCKKLLNVDRVLLFWIDDSETDICCFIDKDTPSLKLHLDKNSVEGRIATAGGVVNLPDAYSNPSFRRVIDEQTSYTTYSLLCMPIMSAVGSKRGNARPLAVLQAINKYVEGRSITEAVRQTSKKGYGASSASSPPEPNASSSTTTTQVLQRSSFTTFNERDEEALGLFCKEVEVVMRVKHMEADMKRVLLREEANDEYNRSLLDMYSGDLFERKNSNPLQFMGRSHTAQPAMQSTLNPNKILKIDTLSESDGSNFSPAVNRIDSGTFEMIGTGDSTSPIKSSRKHRQDSIPLPEPLSLNATPSPSKPPTQIDNKEELEFDILGNVVSRQSPALQSQQQQQPLIQSSMSSSSSSSTTANSSSLLQSSSLSPLESTPQIKDNGEKQSGNNTAKISMKRKESESSTGGEYKMQRFGSSSRLQLLAGKDSEWGAHRAAVAADAVRYLNRWDLNIHAETMVTMMDWSEQIFNSDIALLKRFGVQGETLRCFIEEVQKNYLATPFHNFYHGFSVLHAAWMMMNATQAKNILTTAEQLSVLLAAFCHDVGHPGNTNGYELATFSPLALKYSDESVLERHHCFLAFQIMLRTPGCEVLGKVSTKNGDLQAMRKTIIKCILGTDMRFHFDHCKALEEKISTKTYSAFDDFDLEWVTAADADDDSGKYQQRESSRGSISPVNRRSSMKSLTDTPNASSRLIDGAGGRLTALKRVESRSFLASHGKKQSFAHGGSGSNNSSSASPPIADISSVSLKHRRRRSSLTSTTSQPPSTPGASNNNNNNTNSQSHADDGATIMRRHSLRSPSPASGPGDTTAISRVSDDLPSDEPPKMIRQSTMTSSSSTQSFGTPRFKRSNSADADTFAAYGKGKKDPKETAFPYRKNPLIAAFDAEDLEARLMLCETIVHTADLSSQTFPFHLAESWGKRLSEEFKNQARLEAEAGVKVTVPVFSSDVDFYKSQLFFCKKILLPLFVPVAELMPELQDRLDTLLSNCEEYDLKVSKGTAPIETTTASNNENNKSAETSNEQKEKGEGKEAITIEVDEVIETTMDD